MDFRPIDQTYRDLISKTVTAGGAWDQVMSGFSGDRAHSNQGKETLRRSILSSIPLILQTAGVVEDVPGWNFKLDSSYHSETPKDMSIDFVSEYKDGASNVLSLKSVRATFKLGSKDELMSSNIEAIPNDDVRRAPQADTRSSYDKSGSNLVIVLD